MSELPDPIKTLIGRCGINETTFDNDEMSVALHFGETMFNERNAARAKIAELERATRMLSEQLGLTSQRVAELDIQRKQMIELIDRIVIDEGIDAGVILLDSESRTHYEERNGRQVSVYNNEFFSELGDALVQLSRLIKGTGQ